MKNNRDMVKMIRQGRQKLVDKVIEFREQKDRYDKAFTKTWLYLSDKKDVFTNSELINSWFDRIQKACLDSTIAEILEILDKVLVNLISQNKTHWLTNDEEIIIGQSGIGIKNPKQLRPRYIYLPTNKYPGKRKWEQEVWDDKERYDLYRKVLKDSSQIRDLLHKKDKKQLMSILGMNFYADIPHKTSTEYSLLGTPIEITYYQQKGFSNEHIKKVTNKIKNLRVTAYYNHVSIELIPAKFSDTVTLYVAKRSSLPAFDRISALDALIDEYPHTKDIMEKKIKHMERKKEYMDKQLEVLKNKLAAYLVFDLI